MDETPFLKILAEDFEAHEAEDLFTAKTASKPLSDLLLVNASAWGAAAAKTREMIKLIETQEEVC